MYYTTDYTQNASADFEKFLVIPSGLTDYINTGTSVEKTRNGVEAYCFHGELYPDSKICLCENCGCRMHIHNKYHVRLRHLCIGNRISFVMVDKNRYLCPECGRTRMQEIPFKAEHHQITKELLTYTEELLRRGYNNRQVAELTGLGEHTVKSIDKERLERIYTVETDGARSLRKPEKQSKYLAIDEFKLHNGYKYATHIIDLETGHILWIQEGKKKQVVYDFIEHVGSEWMDGVEAVACDMNSDFQEAFEEKCPHIQPVFDHFHIIKNFNDNVVSAVRKDEQKRLKDEGDEEGYRALKRTRYILTASRKKLVELDNKAVEAKSTPKKTVFVHNSVVPKGGYLERYESLISSNKLLFTADLVKEMLIQAYSETDGEKMVEDIISIIDTCTATENSHFLWFAKLLDSHFEGIIAHAAIPVSSGRIEGINNKIKTLRRQAYGYHDNDYFFLKILDISRKPYLKNPKSHNLFQ